MKRFYDQARFDPAADGFEIRLDERPVRTPARNLLYVPTEGLAQAIAEEWNAQGEEVNPRSMPLTGLANAALDRVAPDPQTFAASLARYGESDLLCYRADTPAPLVRRQAEHWDPLLAWARRRFDIDFEIVCGIMHRPQHEATLRQLAHAVAARGPFELAGLSPLVTIGGSLVIALALAEEAIDLDAAWSAATLDETWQAEQWGEDVDAAAVLEERRRDFAAAYRFLTLVQVR
ncbi:ATP12 family chaperone protein [Sphingosinicella humi]|uniref:ATPase n=1 Tax=Allosphingosinicella humi TaxID=2068657 RepID=A0A2U2J6K7_9SPHN|nr:ATP12 family protein [Sphingosinicella humi]PWG03932.1 ATPase [Sphingosinicella humi]